MALTPADVERLAMLSRLALGEQEREAMLAQLNGFFRIVERMGAVDTQGVEPLATPLSAIHDDALRLRDDIVTEPELATAPCTGSDQALPALGADDDAVRRGAVMRTANQRSAPLTEAGLYLVPKVVE